MRRRESDGVVWFEAKLPGATAAFSTRLGGVSRPPYESLNLGVLTGDERDHVLTNRRRLVGALGLEPERTVIGRQVHGSRLLRHRGAQRPAPFAGGAEPPPEVDAHVTDCAGLALLVFVADCLPIAVADGETVAMVHGGWRGLAAGIIARGLHGARSRGGGDRPGHRALLLRGRPGGARGIRLARTRHR